MDRLWKIYIIIFSTIIADQMAKGYIQQNYNIGDSVVILENLLSYLCTSTASDAYSPSDLMTGPLSMDDGQTVYTHQARQWTSAGFGVWGTDDRLNEGKPFEIEQQGLGVFCTQRESWVGFHEEMNGFGCVESVLCEKYRKANRKVMCLPFLKWFHRFTDYVTQSYSITEYDSARNHIIGFREVKWELDSLLRHYKYRLTVKERYELCKEFYLNVEW